MPEYVVYTERWFRSKHVSTAVTIADSEEEAMENIRAEILAGSYDPSDDYSEQIDGYDDAGEWEVVAADA